MRIWILVIFRGSDPVFSWRPDPDHIGVSLGRSDPGELHPNPPPALIYHDNITLILIDFCIKKSDLDPIFPRRPDPVLDPVIFC